VRAASAQWLYPVIPDAPATAPTATSQIMPTA
jgi:hypothetical protein